MSLTFKDGPWGYHECLTIACPWCGCGVDEPCEEGRTGRQRVPHMARFKAWEKGEKAAPTSSPTHVRVVAFEGDVKTFKRLVLPLLGSNQDSPDPEGV